MKSGISTDRRRRNRFAYERAVAAANKAGKPAPPPPLPSARVGDRPRTIQRTQRGKRKLLLTPRALAMVALHPHPRHLQPIDVA
eukprot:scaffold215510_cov30-Cyclotella_meneghiniana.AAC.1